MCIDFGAVVHEVGYFVGEGFSDVGFGLFGLVGEFVEFGKVVVGEEQVVRTSWSRACVAFGLANHVLGGALAEVEVE